MYAKKLKIVSIIASSKIKTYLNLGSKEIFINIMLRDIKNKTNEINR